MVVTCRKRKAITLVELLLAAAILSLTCAMLFLLFANCILLNEFNRSRTIATMQAEYILEDIKNSDFATLQADITNGDWTSTTAGGNLDIEATFDPGNIAADDDVIPLRNQTIVTTVTDIGAGTPLLDVTVTVSWFRGRFGNEVVSVSLETLIAEP